MKLGRDAEPVLVAAYEGLKSTLGEDRHLTERRLDRVYRLYYRMGRLEEADRLHHEAVFMRLRLAEADESASVLKSLDEFIDFAQSHGTFQGHDRFFADLVEYGKAMPPDHPRRAQYLGNLGWALLQNERYEQAEPLLLASYEERKLTRGMDHGDVHWLLAALIDLYSKTGRTDNVAQYRQVLDAVAQQ